MNILERNEPRLVQTLKKPCPACGSTSTKKFGHAWTGKQRYLCSECERQFTLGSVRREVQNKPRCPKCGKHMNFYKRELAGLRFRCSAYPNCRTYCKIV